MNEKSYTLKNTKAVKEHKVFRGLRCYFSSCASSIDATPKILNDERANYFVNKLSLLVRSVAVFSFHKGGHNAIVIKNTARHYSYVSAFADKVVFLDNVCRDSIVDIVFREESFLRGELIDDNVVYINGLNRENIMNYIRENEAVYKYNKLSNNCARFAADVLLAGCDTTAGKFRHDRPWQMPANTLELAKEIDLFHRVRQGGL